MVDTLEDVIGNKFTMHISSRSSNRQLPAFLQLALHSHCSLLDLPATHFHAYIQHYLRCKRLAPHSTSACIIVPATKGPWSQYRSAFTVLQEFPKGTSIYIDPRTQQSIPAVQRMIALYDPPVPLLELHAFADDTQQLHMTFPCCLAGQRTHVMVDTGASHSFMDQEFAIKYGFHVDPDKGSVQCGGRATAAITGSATVLLHIWPGYRQRVKFYITNLPKDHPLILGNTWLIASQAILNHATRTMQVTKGGSNYEFRCPEVISSIDGGTRPPHANNLSMTQARRLIHQGCKPFLITVQASGKKEFAPQEPVKDPRVQELLGEFSTVFDDIPSGLPPDRGAPFTIDTGDSRPVFSKGFRHTPKEREQIEEQIKEYLEKGWIQPSSSPYGAAVLFVQKKDGSLRMCVDYRGLNKVNIKDRFPLPRIDDLIDKLHGATVFTSLDLRSGYHQIRVAEADVQKTAFVTHKGLYEYRVMPFGMCNAPSSFQRQMNKMLAHLPCVAVYMDDILVFSKTEKEHHQHLRTVLSILKENHFYAKLSKCSFFQKETKFLGYMVDRDGIKMDPDKVSSILNWPVPKNIAEMRSFLGLANHYKRFIQDYSTKVAELTELTKVTNEYRLIDNPPALKAFNWLKQAITTAPVLATPDFEAPFIVVTDASGFGVGATLMQNDPSIIGSPRRPIAFHSAKLSSAERNYPVGEQELLAVISAIKKWRCYLEGAKGGVTIVTDHLPNTYLNTKSAEQFSRRQARWQLELSRVDPKWVYEKGPTNVADALSRCPNLVHVARTQAETCAHDLDSIPDKDAAPRKQSLEIQSDPQGKATPNSQSKEDSGPALLALVAQMPTPDGMESLLEDIAEWYEMNYRADKLLQNTSFTKRKGRWHYGDLVVVPEDKDLQQRCISLHHDGPTQGHPGRNITLELIQRQFWWPSIRKDVGNYVAACASCQQNKAQSRKPGGLLQPLPIPEYPWQSVSMDLITHLPCTARGHTAIVVFVDRLTKMVHFAPSTDTISATGFADLFMSEIFRKHGLPESFVSDRDPRFTSHFFTAICQNLGIKQAMSTAFHPQTDGQTERANRTLEEMLRHYVSPNQDDWDLKLPCAEFAVNNAVKQATGFPPFYLNYGRHPRGPVTVSMDTNIPAANEFVTGLNKAISQAKDSLISAQASMKRNADSHRRDLEFAVGEQVLLSSKNLRLKTMGTKKLLPRFIGPFVILKRIGKLAYELELSQDMPKVHPVFHVSLLRPFTPGSTPPPPLPTVVDGEPEWTVERIINHRDRTLPGRPGRRRRNPQHPARPAVIREYLIKWSGFGHEHNSWQTKQQCANCQDLVQQYLTSIPPVSG
jgi:hypothetical protein